MGVTVVCISRGNGGTKTLLRVAEELRGLGEEALFIAEAGAMAEKVLDEVNEPFRTVVSVLEVIHLVEAYQPYTFLTSCCSGIGRAAMPILNGGGTSTVLVEDSWWHGGALDSLAAGERPNLACVGTDHCRQGVLAAWRGYPAERVQVTGWPDFDLYAEYDLTSVTGRVRASLGLVEEWPFVFLSVDNTPGIGELCWDFVDALNDARPSYLVPAWHPAFDRSVPEERSEVEAALSRFKAGALVDRGEVETTKLVVAADVIASTYSSLLTVGAALRKQVIAGLYPETGLKQMRAKLGVPEFPLVELGCAAKASSCDELREILEQALGGGLGLEAAQRRTLSRLDGQNARRVAELIV